MNFYLYSLRISEHIITWLGPGRKEEEEGHKLYLKIKQKLKWAEEHNFKEKKNILFILSVFNSSKDSTKETEVELEAGVDDRFVYFKTW